MKLRNKQFTTLLLGFVSLATVLSTMYFNNMSNNVKAITQEAAFTVTQTGDNLFMVNEYGDLFVELVRKQGGGTNGPVAYSLNKQKMAPRDKSVLYQTDTDAPWVWELEADVVPTEEQVAQVQRALYGSNYLYLYQIEDYGLESNDEMSLYGATQIAIWSILEGWTPADVVMKTEVIEDESMSALATKIHNLYTDIYEYGLDTSNKTYTSGITIYDALSDTPLTSYTIQESDLNRPMVGRSYYRTPLMKALPNQENGYLFQGEYAYSYQVSLEGAPEGSRIINKNGTVQTLFTTKPGEQLEFYVEIPADKVVGSTGEITVNVVTEQFRRASPVLWLPTVETAYETLVENYFIADSATQTMTVDYTGIGGVAQVIINKRGEQVSGFEEVTTPHGVIFKPIYSQLPLAGSTYEIYILSASGEEVFMGTDDEFYVDGDKLFAGVLTSSSGQTSFDVLPMDDGFEQTGYRIIEVSTTAGYLALTGSVQELFLVKDINGMVSGTATYESQRIKVDFGFTKLEEYFDASNQKAYRPVAGIVFGVYNTNAFGGIPAGSLIGTMTSDQNGLVRGEALDLPVNQQFTVKELSTKDNLTLDSNTYYLDTTVSTGYTDPTMTVAVKTGSGTDVDSLTNYLRPANLRIIRNVERFDVAQGQFVMGPATSANGQIGVYSDEALTTLVKTLENSDFASGVYHSGALADGQYYVKDLGYSAQFDVDSTVYPVEVKSGETQIVNLSNTLKTNTASLSLTDATNPSNPRPMSGVTFNLVLDGKIVATTVTNGSGLAEFDFNVGYNYEIIQVVPVGYNIPTSNPRINATDDDGTFDYDTIAIENTKTTITGNLQLTVKDENTSLSVSGLEYSLYAKDDTGFTTPLFTVTTDGQGVGTFTGIPASHYILKEIKTLDKYQSMPTMDMDLRTLADGDTQAVELVAKAVSVTIRLSNMDSLTDAKLNGARFGLYDASNLQTPTSEFVINADGTYDITSVPSGNYVVKQMIAPAGFNLNSTSASVTVNTSSPEIIDVVFKNTPITALLRIVAVDSKTNTRLPGASFDVFNFGDAELTNPLFDVTTNSNGQANVEGMRRGIYNLIETEAPVGYTRQSTDIRMDLSDIYDGDIVTITVRYTRDGTSDNPTIEIERPETGVFDNTLLFIILSALMIILGIGVGALSFLKLSDR